MNKKAKALVGLLRLSMGWVFFWAFIDKLWGLGYSTASENAWIEGSSPTTGYLTNATTGPFAEYFQSLAGTPWVDWLFMMGLLGIGVALILGIGIRIAGFSGAVMMVLMYASASIPPENNPFMDSHLVYALILLLLAVQSSGRWIGVGGWWSRLSLVEKMPFLK